MLRWPTIILCLALVACGNRDAERSGNPGTGTGAARDFAARDFTKVELAGPDDIAVRTGNAFAVRAEGDPAALARLRVSVDAGKLTVGRIESSGVAEGEVRVRITMPRLDRVDITGAGDLSVDRIAGNPFTAMIAGAGDLTVETMAVPAATFLVAGSGTLGLRGGTAGLLDISIAGAGDLDAPSVTAREARVEIAGSGNVRAVVDGPARIRLMGSGDIDLGPRARCTVEKRGVGDVRCGSVDER